MKRLFRLGIQGQLITVLVLSFAALLAILAIFEVLEYDDVVEWAKSDHTSARFARILPVLPRIKAGQLAGYVDSISGCHEGYTLGPLPHSFVRQDDSSDAIAAHVASVLSQPLSNVRAGFALLDQEDFSYSECPNGEMQFPLAGIVISLRVQDRQWLNAEIHPHEWHFTPTMTDWLLRSAIAFAVVGLVALVFVRRIAKPLGALTEAARSFGDELTVEEVNASGPSDVQRAIQTFNAMQFQVAGQVERRLTTIAAISHDVRSPLTALRLKVELIEDAAVRDELLASVSTMERITKSALEYLKGESRSEEKRLLDLGSLVESECQEFIETGSSVKFTCPETAHLNGRPDALSRAVRNLIENAIKYAGSADVSVSTRGKEIMIVVSDEGPGIPEAQQPIAREPFQRLSSARDAETGGFGLGLAIVQAVVDGHDGSLAFSENYPCGLRVEMSLPRPTAVPGATQV